ncbi:APC family permease [Vibrio sp. Isolate31]|uniref:APC family permease n=1 Tax=unclassified Vibrio TaxID=2614977 RepID=UPI001EFDAE64|nr:MULTISPECIES: APC family permease [unclassified Vibrio]MCG9555139.1 APC family permease [Vibrio sp. Isolate32]MCG9602891.1 APC family permease [Vibrio sp. Isolate31]
MSDNTDYIPDNNVVTPSNKPLFRRVLGLKSLISVAVGLVVSQGVMVLMLQGAGIAGLGFIIPLVIGYFLALTYIYSFSELSLMIPKAGSLSSYTEVAIGHFPAILSVFSGYVVVAMFALSAELLLVDLIIDKIYPDIFPPYSVGFGLLAIFTVLNLFKIDVFSKMQSTLAFIMVVVLLTLGLGAISGTFNPKPESIDLMSTFNPMGAGVLTLVALAIWGFVGAEFVCPLVEEAKEPEKNIPRSMTIGLSIIFGTIALYCLGALLYIPADDLAGSTLPHYDFALAVFGDIGLTFLAVAAVTATGSTVNTSLAAIPRMLYGMANNGQAFPQLKTLSKSSNSPWVAVLFVAIISGLPMIFLGDNPDAIGLLLISAAIAWLVAYIITHINVIVLRNRYPDMKRPFKTPFYPLPQLLGIAGMIYAIIYASPSPELSEQIFTATAIVLGITSVIGMVWVKFVMKKGLFEPESIDKHLNSE